jgi:hypothetical protein
MWATSECPAEPGIFSLFFETWFYHVAEADLEVVILQLQYLEC